MKEQGFPEIEFIGKHPSKRDYCTVALDENIRNNLVCLLVLEEQLAQNSLTVRQEQGAVFAHTLIWSQLQDYYKSELADLTAMS